MLRRSCWSSSPPRTVLFQTTTRRPPSETKIVALLLMVWWNCSSRSSHFLWRGVVQAFPTCSHIKHRHVVVVASGGNLWGGRPSPQMRMTRPHHRTSRSWHSTFLPHKGTVTNVLGFTKSRPCRNSFVVQSSSSSSFMSSKAYTTIGDDESSSSSNTTTTTPTTTTTTSSFPHNDMTGTTVIDILEYSVEWLDSYHIPESEESVVQLLAEALQLPWSHGYRLLRECRLFPPNDNNTNNHNNLAQRPLSHDEWTTYQQMLQRRQQLEPIQYILGKWDFLDFTLDIQAPLLCPRPETEELVHLVAQNMKAGGGGENNNNNNSNNSAIRILDIGCGTGAIGLGLATLVGPQAQVVAIDVEPIAVETSMKNAITLLGNDEVVNQQRYQAFLCSAKELNVSSCLLEEEEEDTSSSLLLFDVVVSNPPYIPRSDMDSLTDDVVQYESDIALCGGSDGMDVIRDIIHKLPHICQKGGYCWMEVDPTHPSLLQEWLDRDSSNLGVSYVQGYQDMFGKDRFVQLQVL